MDPKRELAIRYLIDLIDLSLAYEDDLDLAELAQDEPDE